MGIDSSRFSSVISPASTPPSTEDHEEEPEEEPCEITDTMLAPCSAAGIPEWHGGILAGDGKIYCVPGSADAVLCIDPAARTATTFGTVGSGIPNGTEVFWQAMARVIVCQVVLMPRCSSILQLVLPRPSAQ